MTSSSPPVHAIAYFTSAHLQILCAHEASVVYPYCRSPGIPISKASTANISHRSLGHGFGYVSRIPFMKIGDTSTTLALYATAHVSFSSINYA
jgi:hypothetical protein